MTPDDVPDFSPSARFTLSPSTREPISVHALGEFVFCPRAGWIAHESRHEAGNEEPNLGPRLDLYIDYDEVRFTEALNHAWNELQLWLMLMVPAVLVVVLAWRLHSPLAGAVMSLPVMYLIEKCRETLLQICGLVKEQRRFRAAPEEQIDLPPDGARLNWWSLRKAGFDCNNPPDPLIDTAKSLSGRPWRTLRRGEVCVPVIRRPRGTKGWGEQHEIRIAAYCRLIEQKYSVQSPFGVILFAGTDQCDIIHNTPGRQSLCDRAMAGAVASLAQRDRVVPHSPDAPRDGRCRGCRHGKPRRFRQGTSETILNDETLIAYTTNSVRPSDGKLRGVYHCDCGDRFKWIPSHKDAINLGIARDG